MTRFEQNGYLAQVEVDEVFHVSDNYKDPPTALGRIVLLVKLLNVCRSVLLSISLTPEYHTPPSPVVSPPQLSSSDHSLSVTHGYHGAGAVS